MIGHTIGAEPTDEMPWGPARGQPGIAAQRLSAGRSANSPPAAADHEIRALLLPEEQRRLASTLKAQAQSARPIARTLRVSLSAEMRGFAACSACSWAWTSLDEQAGRP